MSDSPIHDGENGNRDANGRFVKGNSGGPGRPRGQRVLAIQSAMFDAVTDEDIRAIVKALVNEAKAGDVRAASEIFNRLIGRPGDAPVVAESAGEQYTPLQTTPKQALAALEKFVGEPYDPYCGLGPDSASSTGRSPHPSAALPTASSS